MAVYARRPVWSRLPMGLLAFADFVAGGALRGYARTNWRYANFFGIFVGIESPDPETLVQMKKKQNTRRNIAECIHKIYGYGMFVTAGFIVGFDTEKGSIGPAMIDFVEEASIAVCMVGLLYALPGTQLTRRLAKEGRLHEGHDLMKVEQAGDQCTLGCNFRHQAPAS
jgi:hypothetical protein